MNMVEDVNDRIVLAGFSAPHRPGGAGPASDSADDGAAENNCLARQGTDGPGVVSEPESADLII